MNPMPKSDKAQTYAERRKKETEKRRINLRKEAKAKRILARERFKHSAKAARKYQKGLLSIARHVGELVDKMLDRGKLNTSKLEKLLHDYAELITPYAKKLANAMLEEADDANERAWKANSESMGKFMKEELANKGVGGVYEALMNEQVNLIKSIPIEAAQRVHKLSTEALSTSTRASEIMEEILRTGKVTESRAMTIARTETSRASSNLTEARARSIGSKGYIWRTAKDADVREMHQHLEGVYIAWDAPPVAGSNGERAHAGCIYNCRCWPEPVIPDEL